VKLSEADLAYLEKNGRGGIYAIAIRDDVWSAQLEADGDHDESGAYPKCYIGQSGASKGIKRRIVEHSRKLRNGKHVNAHLQSAWDKYGEESFECFVIESCQDVSLDARENFWMWLHNAQGRKHGFNISIHASAPMRGRKASDETRAKLSAAHIGKKRSDEHRAKISANSAMKNNPETRAKNSAARIGKKHSDEARARMSAAHIGKKRSDEHRAKISANNPMKNPEAVAKRLATFRANKERKRREMILTNLAIIEPQARSAA
jgi:group I intron endonuclease